MKQPVIVFDFDKTLTYKDTLFGFYAAASRSVPVFKMKRPFFLFVAAAYKLGLISNLTLKKAGVWFYLRGLSHNELNEIGQAYAGKIELNNIYSDEFLKYPSEQIIIISASFEEYLKPLFPNHRVVGSRLSYSDENRVNGISVNMYSEEKKEWLHNQGIKEIDSLYTDSYSDKPLMEIAECTFLVKNGAVEIKVRGEEKLV